MTAESENLFNPHEIENARTGYQASIEMWAHCGDEVWTRFNVMLVANSIIIAVIGLTLTSDKAMPSLILFLPLVGIVFCLLWFLLMKRGFDYQIYYLLSARELEEKYLFNPIKTLSRGEAFAEGKTVTVVVNGAELHLRMSLWSRIARAYRASYIVIAVFGSVYIFMLLGVLL